MKIIKLLHVAVTLCRDGEVIHKSTSLKGFLNERFDFIVTGPNK